MRKSYSAFTAACLCLLLSACNTSEALTPKAEVPNAADTTNTAENRDTLRETPVRR
jgi:predicted component of type VI protein secretion system